MAPLHHHFEKKGWYESQVVMRFYILSILFGVLALTTLKIR
jgi:phospho-N-acetylmuramoyl-pentapeptide-transferase